MKEPKRGDRVLVWDDYESIAVERLYLSTIEGANYPIQVVPIHNEDDFNNGQKFDVTGYKHMKPIAPEITVGKWYKKDRYLMVWNGGKSTYGFYRGDWSDRWSLLSADNLVEATEEEVSAALIAEAKRIGYKQGDKINKPIRGYSGFIVRANRYDYHPKMDQLCCGGTTIYYRGKWADVTQNEYTVEELEKLTGIKDLKIKK